MIYGLDWAKFAAFQQQQMLHMRDTLGLEVKDLLSSGTESMMVRIRASVGLTRSTLRPLLPS